jgi:hypothetical protein
MFSANDIEARVRERPFRPLRFVTSSGRSYDVTHPDLVFTGRRDIMVGVASNDNPKHYESVSRVALMHITDLQDMPTPAPKDTNGPAA